MFPSRALAGVAGGTGTVEAVNSVGAGGVVMARAGLALIDVLFAVYTLPARLAHALVASNLQHKIKLE